MAKLRKIQFYRNGEAEPIVNSEEHNVSDLKSAYVYAEAMFKQTGKHNEMEDGEILLYRFSYAGQVHTLVGVVHAEAGSKSLEVLANYDMLGAEISNEINAAIAELVGSATIASVSNGVVTLKAGIKQENGIVSQGTGSDITLAKVATTGAAADVNLSEGVSVIAATDVEGALVEIATEIDGMDLTATDVVALNNDKTALQAGKISESDGKVSVEAAATLVEFNQPISTGTTGNKVATMADVTAAQNNATVVGEKAIEVKAATGEGATGKVVSLKIAEGEKVLTQDANGLKTNLGVKIATVSTEEETETTPAGTYLQITDGGQNVVAEVNANVFVKDGMLSSAGLVTDPDGQPAGDYIKLTFNTDADQAPIYISVSDLCDVYTVDDVYLQLNANNKFKIEHKTQSNFTGTDAIKSFGGNVAEGAEVDVTIEGAEQSAKFTVPSFVVDAAGHVTAAEDKVVKVALPAAQTIKGETAIENGSSFVSTAVTATKGENDDNYTLSSTSTVKTQTMTGIAVEGAEDGLATASDVKTYVDAKVGAEYTATGELTMSDSRVITHNESGVITSADKQENPEITSKKKGDVITGENNTVTITVPIIEVNAYGHVTTLTETSYKVKYPTVSGELGQIVITTTADTDNAGTNYKVGLAEAKAEYAETVTDSFDDNTNTFTFIKKVETDDFGRVTKVETVTMSENWDCGIW